MLCNSQSRRCGKLVILPITGTQARHGSWKFYQELFLYFKTKIIFNFPSWYLRVLWKKLQLSCKYPFPKKLFGCSKPTVFDHARLYEVSKRFEEGSYTSSRSIKVKKNLEALGEVWKDLERLQRSARADSELLCGKLVTICVRTCITPVGSFLRTF